MRSEHRIHIRSAVVNDAAQIAQWQVAMALETEAMELKPDVVLAGVKHVFAQKNIGEYLIGEVDSKPVACTLLLNEWSDWRCGNVLWIHSLYVEPKFRRCGLFTALYDHIKGNVERNDALRGIRLYVDRSNQNAIATYTSLGMDGAHYQLFEWMK